MPIYIVHCASATTGSELRLLVDAEHPGAAEAAAQNQGFLVSMVEATDSPRRKPIAVGKVVTVAIASTALIVGIFIHLQQAQSDREYRQLKANADIAAQAMQMQRLVQDSADATRELLEGLKADLRWWARAPIRGNEGWPTTRFNPTTGKFQAFKWDHPIECVMRAQFASLPKDEYDKARLVVERLWSEIVVEEGEFSDDAHVSPHTRREEEWREP